MAHRWETFFFQFTSATDDNNQFPIKTLTEKIYLATVNPLQSLSLSSFSLKFSHARSPSAFYLQTLRSPPSSRREISPPTPRFPPIWRFISTGIVIDYYSSSSSEFDSEDFLLGWSTAAIELRYYASMEWGAFGGVSGLGFVHFCFGLIVFSLRLGFYFLNFLFEFGFRFVFPVFGCRENWGEGKIIEGLRFIFCVFCSFLC